MSKELELIRTLIDGANEYEKKTGNTNPTVYLSKNNLLVIKQALHRLEEIDNANPSEALELLGFMGNFIIPTALGNEHLKDFCDKEFAIIKQSLLKAQKEHKALEIIKEKNVNMFGFKRDIKQLGNRFTYKYYQSNLGNYHSGFEIQELTEEEFSLLKEILGC